jgi:hypothetical protein
MYIDPWMWRCFPAACRHLGRSTTLLMGHSDEQEDFVNWWEGAVTVRHGGDTKNAALRSCFSKSDAESETGISQQQVSRWRGRHRRS